MIRFLFVFLFTIYLFPMANAQTKMPDRKNIRPVLSNYFINPHPVENGILLCNEKNTKLFVLYYNDTVPRLLLDTVANFNNLSVSPDKKKIAFRKLHNNTYRLLEYDFNTKKIKEIFRSKNFCSNLSYSDSIKTVFSLENTVYLISQNDTQKHIFKNKVINTSISPDGNLIAILTQKGILTVIDAHTAKQKKKLSEFCTEFEWSPDSKKLAYKRYFAIDVWDIESNTVYKHGEGTNICWSQDSKHIVFQRNIAIGMKFVNSDLFISTFDASKQYQITSTNNVFEMQAVFVDTNTIVYLTYEDRQIIKAGLSGFKITDKKILFKTTK